MKCSGRLHRLWRWGESPFTRKHPVCSFQAASAAKPPSLAVCPSDPAPARVFGAAAPFRFPHFWLLKHFPVQLFFFTVLKIFGGGGNRTPVLIREIHASTDLAVYLIVGTGLAKRHAPGPYSGKSYNAVSGQARLGGHGAASPDCNAEAVPQSGGTVPRNYAAKA